MGGLSQHADGLRGLDEVVGPRITEPQADAEFLSVHQFADRRHHVGQIHRVPEVLYGYGCAKLGLEVTGEGRQNDEAVATSEVVGDPKLADALGLGIFGEANQVGQRDVRVGGQMKLDSGLQCRHFSILD